MNAESKKGKRKLEQLQKHHELKHGLESFKNQQCDSHQDSFDYDKNNVAYYRIRISFYIV